MVDAELARDLLSFGKPILVLGDPFQLPPVKGGGYFTESAPDVMLTEIHRQAADNPIIRLSQIVRSGGELQEGAYGETPGHPARRDRRGEGAGRRPGAGRRQPHAARLQPADARPERLRRAAAASRATGSSACATTGPRA